MEREQESVVEGKRRTAPEEMEAQEKAAALGEGATGKGKGKKEKGDKAMSVVKRGAIYWYDFRYGGRRVQESTRQGNKKIAGEMESARKTQLLLERLGVKEKPPAPEFTDFSKKFLEVVKAERKRGTYLFYRTALENLKPTFGGKKLDEITAEQIEAHKAARLEAGLSNASVNHDLATLRRILRLALRQRKIAHSPFSDGAVGFLREKGRERVLTYTEEAKYLAAASPLLKDVATLILECGLRPGEVFNLRQQDVNLFERSVHIRAGKTENARREVALTDSAFDVLKRRVSQAQGPFLFPKHVGRAYDWTQPMTSVQDLHEKALESSKVKPAFRLYDLRHTYATRAAESGLDLLTLKRLMGHANLATLERYTHLSKRHLAAAQEKLAAYRVERAIAEAEATQNVSTALH